MSDYFVALMRSTGSAPSDGGLRRDPPAPPTQSDGVIEQHVEVVAGAAQERLQFKSSNEPSIGALPEASDSELIVTHASPSTRATDSTAGRKPASPALSSVPLDQQLHPAVRAALYWVAADPVAQQPASIDLHQSAQRGLARSKRPNSPDFISTDELSSRLRPADPATGSRIAQQTYESLTPQRMRPAAPDAVDRPAPARGQDVEISIGTIHVSVDAPQTRVAAQPAPAASQAMRTRLDERSFSRCRLPRI